MGMASKDSIVRGSYADYIRNRLKAGVFPSDLLDDVCRKVMIELVQSKKGLTTTSIQRKLTLIEFVAKAALIHLYDNKKVSIRADSAKPAWILTKKGEESIPIDVRMQLAKQKRATQSRSHAGIGRARRRR